MSYITSVKNALRNKLEVQLIMDVHTVVQAEVIEEQNSRTGKGEAVCIKPQSTKQPTHARAYLSGVLKAELCSVKIVGHIQCAHSLSYSRDKAKHGWEWVLTWDQFGVLIHNCLPSFEC